MGQIQVLKRDRSLVTYEKHNVPKEHLLAYWDMQHTVGSDLKLSPKATAVYVVTQHLVMRDLLQAVWRLRGLDKGQTVSFVTSTTSRAMMSAHLSKIIGSDFPLTTISDLLFYAKVNERYRLSSLLTYRGFQQLLKGVLQEKAVDHLVSMETRSRARAVEKMTQVLPLFIDEDTSELYHLSLIHI